MVEVMITMAYRPLGYASFSTMMMTFQHIPKPLPKQEQPSVFPTSFSILGGVGWLQLAPPNLRSINLQIRIQKKNASLPQLQHHVIMLRHHVILLSEVRSQFAEKKQEIAIQKPFPLLDSSCQTSSKCMLFTQTFHARLFLSGTFPWENKGTRSRRSSSVTSSHGSLPKTGCHMTWPRWNHNEFEKISGGIFPPMVFYQPLNVPKTNSQKKAWKIVAKGDYLHPFHLEL